MTSHETEDIIQEQDRLLPIANVQKIMRRVVPESGKLSKESKECVQECVSEFIQFVVAEASDRCTAEKRKTITCDDLLQALSVLSFEPYADILRVYIDRYRKAAKNQPTTETEASTSESAPADEPTQLRTASLQPTDCIFVDNQTGQHYMRIDGENGVTFMPVTLNRVADN